MISWSYYFYPSPIFVCPCELYPKAYVVQKEPLSSYAHQGNDITSNWRELSRHWSWSLKPIILRLKAISGSKSDRAAVQIPIHLVALIPLPTEMEQKSQPEFSASFTSAVVFWQTHQPIFGKLVTVAHQSCLTPCESPPVDSVPQWLYL